MKKLYGPTSLHIGRVKKNRHFYPHFVDKGGRGWPMWISFGSDNVDTDFLYVLGLFKGSFGLFIAYLVVFGLFVPNTE